MLYILTKTNEWVVSTIIHIVSLIFQIQIIVHEEINSKVYSESFPSSYKEPELKVNNDKGHPVTHQIVILKTTNHYDLIIPKNKNVYLVKNYKNPLYKINEFLKSNDSKRILSITNADVVYMHDNIENKSSIHTVQKKEALLYNIEMINRYYSARYFMYDERELSTNGGLGRNNWVDPLISNKHIGVYCTAEALRIYNLCLSGELKMVQESIINKNTGSQIVIDEEMCETIINSLCGSKEEFNFGANILCNCNGF
jgi:hypothetical protein